MVNEIDLFLNYLEYERNASKNTVESYNDDLLQFYLFLIGDIDSKYKFDDYDIKVEIKDDDVEIDSIGTDDITGFIELKKLQKEIGDFLIVDLDDIRKASGSWAHEGNLKVYDPENGKLLLHLYKKGVNWKGLDQPIFYPLFNGFLDWAQGKKIRTAPNQ